MKGWLGPLAALLLAATAAHAVTLAFVPSVVMDRAIGELGRRGVALHAFTAPLRITPETQAVVRSSPDMFYALCRYDLGKVAGGRIRVRMGAWPGYQSLAFFDAQTNNFLTRRGEGRAVEVDLAAPGMSGEGLVASPSERGVILIRRLAPTAELFEAARAAAAGDACAVPPE